MDQPTDIDLLMIGKTGNGKSATGNSILKRKAFKSRSSTSSVTKEVDYDFSEFGGRKLKVVDGPGIGDTRLDTEKAVSLVLRALEYAIAANTRGYHAFLLVVRFGGRFTEEDVQTVKFLKNVFGDDFVQKYCILVLTCGDNFENIAEETGQTVHEWCEEQDGIFKELVVECNMRVALFDNVTKDEAKKNRQIANLLQMVDNLGFDGRRYTNDNFKCAEDTRIQLTVELKSDKIKEETMIETSIILQKLQEIQNLEKMEEKTDPLEALLVRAESLHDNINAQDRGSGVLQDLCSTVKSIMRSISDEIKFSNRMKTEQVRIRKQEEEFKRIYEETIQRQRQEYEKAFREKERAVQERMDFEKQQLKERKELEEKNRKEKEKLQQQMEEEKKEHDRQKVKSEKLEEEYRKVKAENDKGFFRKIADGVSNSFSRFKNWWSR